MALKDWKKTYLGVTLVRYEHKKFKRIIYGTPLKNINGQWILHSPNGQKIAYRGKSEVKKAMSAYMRSH